MALRYIFNGYYRSGTTLIWEILKESNTDFTVFYEPLHPNLIDKIRHFSNNRDKLDSLHGKRLWNEYIIQGDTFIDNLDEKQVFRKYMYPKNKQELFNYLDIYDNLSGNIILQTNRLHFYLDDIVEKYNIKAFHIIRNPFDVYSSLIQIYKNKRSSFKHFVLNFYHYLKYRYTPKLNFWGVKRSVDFIYENFKIPGYWQETKIKKHILNDSFKMHLLNWILCNYLALNKNQNFNFKLILYEDLIKNKAEVQKKIEKYTDLLFDTRRVKEYKKVEYKYQDLTLYKIVNSIGMNREYNYILEKINLRNR